MRIASNLGDKTTEMSLISEDRQIEEARVFIIEESLGYLVNYLAKRFSHIEALARPQERT